MMSQNSHWNGQPREKLQRPRGEFVDLEQVVARAGDRGHVGLLSLLVTPLGGTASGEVRQELRPGRLRLADEDHVALSVERLLLDRGVGASNADHRVDPLQPLKDLEHPLDLDDHACQADDIVLAQRIPVDVLDVLVEQVELVARAQPRKGRQRAVDHRAPQVAGIERERVVKPPVRRLEARVDQTDRKGPFSTIPPECQPEVIRKILQHLGLWEESHAPPDKEP